MSTSTDHDEDIEIISHVTPATNTTKKRKRPYASARHVHTLGTVDTATPVPVQATSTSASRSPSPSASVSTLVSPVSSSPSATHNAHASMCDTRTFDEMMCAMLHSRGDKNMGSMVSDERYADLIRACGLPSRDESVTRSIREAIALHKYVAGAGRLFAWKPNCVKEDFAAGAWPADMYEVVRFSDVSRVLKSEHLRMAGAKAQKMYASIKTQYKGITHEMCKVFCKHCPCCAVQQVDVMKSKRAKIAPIIVRHVWLHVTFDLISMLTDPGGENGEWLYILTVIDHFSKYAYAVALTQKTSAAVAAELSRVFMFFGAPTQCQSDNGTEFKGMVEKLMQEEAVVYSHGQPYKPQSQGVVERFNGTLQSRIKSIRHQTGEKDWYRVLPKAVVAYNTTPHTTTGMTPYKLMFGQDPPARRITTTHENTSTNAQIEIDVEDTQTQTETAWEGKDATGETGNAEGKYGNVHVPVVAPVADEDAMLLPHGPIRTVGHANYTHNATRMAVQYNKKVSHINSYSVGDYVSVDIALGDHPNRLPQRNIGGVIVECTRHTSYRIWYARFTASRQSVQTGGCITVS